MPLTARTFSFSAAFALTFAFAAPALAGPAGGSGGGLATCIDAQESCEVCADEQCPTETQDCCDETGCKDLVLCLLDNCANSLSDQLALIQCAATSCSAELTAAGGALPPGPGVTAAQDLGTCLSGPLQNPPAGACTDCVDEFGTGGAGGATTTTTTTGSGGAPTTSSSSTGGTTGSGGAGTGGATSSSSTGGNDADVEDDSGCECGIAGDPSKSALPWLGLLGLAGISLARRRR